MAVGRPADDTTKCVSTMSVLHRMPVLANRHRAFTTMCAFVTAALWTLFLTTCEGALTNDPGFETLLHGPRLHFSGRFVADICTGNNKIANYDIESFLPHHSLSKQDGGNGGYNPHGTNYFMLKNASIRKVCYESQICTSDGADDPAIGSILEDGGLSTSAKMVDVDPLDFTWTQIWALKIKIHDYLQADSGVLTMRNIWKKQILAEKSERVYSGLFHGVLSNVKFIETKKSSVFFSQLKHRVERTKKKLLSIRFILDLYDKKSTEGRIYGSIGCQGDDAPTSSLYGRALFPSGPMFSEATFAIDNANDVIVMDLGNSLPTDLDGSPLKEDGVSYHLGFLPQTNDTCMDAKSSRVKNFDIIGEIPTTDKNLLLRDAGFVSFPVPLGKSSILANRQLVILKVRGNRSNLTCNDTVLMERCDGVHLMPKSEFVYRKESGASMRIELIATSFGRLLPNARIDLSPDAESKTQVLVCCTPKWDWPSELTSDKNGIARAVVGLPILKSPRKIVDGQLYRIFYSAKQNCTGKEKEHHPDLRTACQSNVLIVKIFDHVEYPSVVTWADHVYPIFTQYANLYPVMKGSNFDMSNYYSVIKYKNAIRASLSLPLTHTNFMPASRDLSHRKRRMVIQWLSQDTPKVGRIQKLINIQRLRKLLQDALELEHATIPPYLTALWSIRDGYNRKVHRIIKMIVRQEMLHMGLAANVLNAVGGHPSLNHSTFIPQYPSKLPGGVEPDLIVPLEKLSPKLIKDVFIRIEKPDTNFENQRFRYKIFNHMEMLFARKHCRSNASKQCEEDIGPKLKKAREGCSKEVSSYIRRMEAFHLKDMERRKKHRSDPMEIFRYKDTIASFYTHVLFVIAYLTDCGNNNSIFTGRPSFQLTTDGYRYGNGKLTKVGDYATAVAAIKTVIEEGEGTSVCDPSVHYHDTWDDLSHHSMFHMIIKKHEVAIQRLISRPSQNYTSSSNAECKDTSYDFSGPQVSYISDAVWPILANARRDSYKKGGLPHVHSFVFARLYNKLLGALHKSFNGEKEHFEKAKFLMYSVDYYGRRLVQMSIDSKRSRFVGPNAAPLFIWLGEGSHKAKAPSDDRFSSPENTAKVKPNDGSIKKGEKNLKHKSARCRKRRKYQKLTNEFKNRFKRKRKFMNKYTDSKYDDLSERTFLGKHDILNLIENDEDFIDEQSLGDRDALSTPEDDDKDDDTDDDRGPERNSDAEDYDSAEERLYDERYFD